MHFARVESRTDLIQGSPLPGEFDIGGIALPADAGDRHQFPSGSGDGESGLFSLRGGRQHSKRVDTGWREQDIPARWGREIRRTSGTGTGDPSVLLQYERFGRKVILVGNPASVQPKLLYILERIRSIDQIGSKTTSQKITRRAEGEQERAKKRDNDGLGFLHLAHCCGRAAPGRGRLSPHVRLPNMFKLS